jgi:hypothetical protein
MRVSRYFALLALAVFLPGCGKDSSTGPKAGLKIFDCTKGSLYTIGQTVNGSLASTDCVDPGGVGRADYYQFTLTSAGPVAITVTSTSNPQPRIVNAILLPNQDVTHFRYTSLSGSTTVGGTLPAGTYVVVVAATEDNQSSNYTLTSSATKPATFACGSIPTLLAGSTVSGTFAASDCADPDGYAPADYYAFTLATQGTVTMRLTSTTGAVVVAIADEDDNIFDYAIGDETSPAVISDLYPAGRYIAIAAAYDETQRGGYTLELSSTPPGVSGAGKVSRLERVSPWNLHSLRRW